MYLDLNDFKLDLHAPIFTAFNNGELMRYVKPILDFLLIFSIPKINFLGVFDLN